MQVSTLQETSCSPEGIVSEDDSDVQSANNVQEKSEEKQSVSRQNVAKTKKKALAALDAAKRKGVVYMSRVPPHLKPQKLRHMLSKFGEIGRVYLAPEDPGLRQKRKKFKGNTGKNFSEGWVEFHDKKDAKRIAEMLNGNPMGGKRRSAYHYDIWCLKYLPKFKWDHLTEEIAYQNAVREQKLANELSAAKRERDFYLSRVDRSKAADAKLARQKRKSEAGHESASAPAAEVAEKTGVERQEPRMLRAYGQKRAKLDSTEDADAPMVSRDVLTLLAGKR